MTTSQDKFCKECGYLNCPHEMTALAKVETTALAPVNTYDSERDHSMDHKSRVLMSQAINFAMMRYFGDDSTKLLCYDWLAARGPLKPFKSLGDYLAYRRNYNFEKQEGVP